MSNANLKINERCIQCGSCLGCGFDFLNSAGDGSIVVNPGTVLDGNSTAFRTLTEICPADAFELKNNVNKNEILDNMIQELKNYSGLPVPCERDLKFRKNEYNIPLPVASGELRYEYATDSAAEKAALREFERAMYAQIDNIILKIITEYRIKYVKPYYTDTIEEGSVYAKSNEKVSEILAGIKNILGDKLPADFASVNIFPKGDMYWKMLNKGEGVSDELISAVKNEFDYPSSQYDCYWRTDDMEVLVGTDRRGNSKWKDKYCYMDVRDAFKELAKDILNSCGWASDSIEQQATDKVGYLVRMYNEELKKVINKKIEQIEAAC